MQLIGSTLAFPFTICVVRAYTVTVSLNAINNQYTVDGSVIGKISNFKILHVETNSTVFSSFIKIQANFFLKILPPF